MKNIDYLNISKYINKPSDRQPAYIGHVNYALNNSEGSGVNAFTEIDELDDDGNSITVMLSTQLKKVPVLPSKSLYGHEKSLNITNWIGPDFEPVSSTLALLQGIRNDKKEEFAVPGVFIDILVLLIASQQTYAKSLIEIRDSLENLVQIYIDRKVFYENSSNNTWDLSNLTKHINSIKITVDEVILSIADAEEKKAYFESLFP